jgi:hypothetical protein
MSAQDEKVKQAMAAFKAGRKEEARTLLMAVVDENESHETAWLYLSAMVDTLEEQQICLENVLAINPANEKARKGLDSLNQKRAAQPKPAAPQAPTAFNAPFPSFETPPPKPGAKSPPIGAEFATASGDNLVSGAPGATAFDGGFDFAGGFSDSSDESLDWLTGGSTTPAAPAVPPAAPGQPDPFGIPTSVDWGRTDGPAAHGSGKQVELPSAQEYDEWVQNLNLSNNDPASPGLSAPAAPPSFDADTSAPFGDTSFMMDSSPFVMEDEPAAAPASFNGGLFESAWDADDDAFGSVEAPAPDPFGSDASPDPFGAASAPAPGGGTPSPFGDLDAPMGDEYSPAGEEDDLSFSLDDDQPSKNEFGSLWSNDFEEVSAPVAAPPKAAPRIKPQASGASSEDYFRYIPDEIEAKAGRISAQSLMLLAGVVVLIVLNAVSFAMLL